MFKTNKKQVQRPVMEWHPQESLKCLKFVVLPNPFPSKHGEMLPYALSLHQRWVGTPFPTACPRRWRSPSECWHNEGLCPSDSHWSLQKNERNSQLYSIALPGQQGFLQPFWLKKTKKVSNLPSAPLKIILYRKLCLVWPCLKCLYFPFSHTGTVNLANIFN